MRSISAFRIPRLAASFLQWETARPTSFAMRVAESRSKSKYSATSMASSMASSMEAELSSKSMAVDRTQGFRSVGTGLRLCAGDRRQPSVPEKTESRGIAEGRRYWKPEC